MSTIVFSCVATALLLNGCAGGPPHRPSTELPDDFCSTDVFPSVTGDNELSKADFDDERRRNCWESSWERHDDYDLFFVEFDDQGWLARQERGDQTQIGALTQRLTALIKGRDPASSDDLKRLSALPDDQPLSLLVYTHGWHHSAAANDSNVRKFRRLLEGTAAVEKELCLLKRREAGGEAAAKACSNRESITPWKKKRRVVGIYVGWRGDSILGPVIEHLSIWDRKLAAEKVALGSVQELFARLHNFYVQHECHFAQSAEAKRICADVRMLTVGHSFGGLITYRSLAPRLMMNVVETHRRNVAADHVPYAYSVGDLTVLINPAFEGTRFEAPGVRRHSTFLL